MNDILERQLRSLLVTTRTVAHLAANHSPPHRYLLSADHRHPCECFNGDLNQDDNDDDKGD